MGKIGDKLIRYLDKGNWQMMSLASDEISTCQTSFKLDKDPADLSREILEKVKEMKLKYDVFFYFSPPNEHLDESRRS